MNDSDDIREIGCPFCGAKRDAHAGPWAGISRLYGPWWVECRGCGAGGPVRPRKIEAIEAWNNRKKVDTWRDERIALLETELNDLKDSLLKAEIHSNEGYLSLLERLGLSDRGKR